MFYSGGSEAARFDTNKNLGIGTTQPNSTVTIISSNTLGALNILNSTNSMFFVNGTNGWTSIGTAMTGKQKAPLHVKVNGTTDPILMLEGSANTDAISFKLQHQGAVIGFALAGGAGSFFTTAALNDAIIFGQPGYNLLLGTGSTEGMRISSTGLVGINTSSPAYTLDVEGNVSGVSIYAQANVSAKGYITRSDVYDESQGSALAQVKDASAYLNKDGTINHVAFGYSYATYSKEEPVLTPELNVDGKMQDVQTGTNTVTEEGVDLVKEVALLKQAVYELNQKVECIKAAPTKAKEASCN